MMRAFGSGILGMISFGVPFGVALSASVPLGVAAGLMIAAPASAQQTTCDTAFRDWSVCAPTDPKECFVVSPPVSSEARRSGSVVSVNRGDIRLFVTIRPADGVDKEVSFTGGYPFRPGSAVTMNIGGSDYVMSPGSGDSDEWAWPPSPDKDIELVTAMQAGSSARITAVSSRGTTTIDGFSLLGFTAALEAAEAACR